MYIAPNTNIRILKDVPLEPSYENTLYFSSLSAQTSYFSSKAKYTLTQNTYQRVNRGVIRVGVKADSLYDCNYVMFQNAGYGNKWFYAFILKVEFVNNTTADVFFDIDVMQTYAFDYTLKECLIERQHTVTDVAGDNLVPENLETGEYVNTAYGRTVDIALPAIVVACACSDTGGDYYGGMFNGTYSGINYVAFDNTQDGVNKCKEFIKSIGDAGKPDSIVSVFMMPKALVGSEGSTIKQITEKLSLDITPSDIDGYVPRNKKLFTSPYSFLAASTRMGNISKYEWEYFSGTDGIIFTLLADTTPSPSVWLCPQDYKGLDVNYDEACVMTGFPQIAYNVDTFRAWLAQSAGTLAVNSAASVGTAMYRGGQRASQQMTASLPRATREGGYAKALSVAAGITGAAGAAPVAIGLAALSVVAEVIEHAYLPTVARGAQSGMVWAGTGDMGFRFYHRHITVQFAKIIDEYFDMYGYAVHRVATPNRSARPHWTYVKTVGCAIVGSMPTDDGRKIQDIYDNGVRFWKDPDEVGNYSLDNRP